METRPFSDLLIMWSQYDHRELLDWQWMYERLLLSDSSNKHCDYLLQDYNAITQLIREVL